MPAGRPTILTPELQDKILEAVRAGAYVETAVKAAGVSKQTFYNWLKRGNREKKRLAKNTRARMRKREAPYVEFVDAIQKTFAEAELRDLVLIGIAAKTQWQAAAWRLERKFPQRYARRERHEISGPRGKPIPIVTAETADLEKLSDQELDDLDRAIEDAIEGAADRE